jgi:hypothetical protein
MSYLIFGSTAIKHWYPDFNRTPKDLDIIGKGIPSTKDMEYHWCPSFAYVTKNNVDSKYVDPNFLYTIKISHAAWDIRWEKTMHDIKFLKNKGCVLDEALYKSLLNDWETIHYKKKIVVKGNANEFFTSTISRRYNHDELHKKVMWYNVPLHESIRKDINDVHCSRELWNNLSEEDKMRCALEEAYVFAIERYSDYPATIALSKALKTLITSSTKGWFNKFLIDNFFTLLYYERERYINIFKEIKNESNR